MYILVMDRSTKSTLQPHKNSQPQPHIVALFATTTAYATKTSRFQLCGLKINKKIQ